MQMANSSRLAGSEVVGRNGRFLLSAALGLLRPISSHLEVGPAPPIRREEGRAKAAIRVPDGAVGNGLALTAAVRARLIVSRTKDGSASPRPTLLIKITVSRGR